MLYATILWSSRCARYEAMLASAQAAEEELRERAGADESAGRR